MKTYLTFLISVLGAAVAFAQPTIPVNNVSPVAANSLIGKIGTAGRGQSIPIGSGLAFLNGALVATGGGGGGSGTVTSIPDGSTNGVTWTVATRTTTPTFTFSLGAITPTSILASGAISAGTTITAGTTFIATGVASPSTTTAGQFGFDTNAWASGRGAIQVNDGTANTYVVAVQASDVPLNGQFPRWNTGGTITWETPAGAGNVNAAGALTSGDIVIGQGGTDVATSPVIQIAPGEATVNGNLTITGNTTFGNLTTGNLTVSGNVSSAGTLDGQLWIGSTASGNFTKATLTEGSNISIVNGANSITISASGGGSGDVVGPASSTDHAIARFDGATGKLLQDTSAVTLSDAGALTLPDNVRQTFNPGANAAGINVGSIAGDPDTSLNGDLWYDSTANQLTARINGADVALGAGGGTPGGSNTQVQFNNSSAFGGISGLTSDGTNVTAGSGNLRATSPRITTSLFDANGATMLAFNPTSSADRWLETKNTTNASNLPPALSAVGTGTNIALQLSPKGASAVWVESSNPQIMFTNAVATTRGGIGVASSTNDIVTGSASGDLALYSYPASSKILLGPNVGNTGGVAFSTPSSQPTITAFGAGTDVRLDLASKGSDYVTVNSALPGMAFRLSGTLKSIFANATADGNPGVVDAATDDFILANFITAKKIRFSTWTSGSRLTSFSIAAAPASAVNYLEVTPSIATASPSLSAVGSDADIDVLITPKGTGAVKSSGDVEISDIGEGVIIKSPDGTRYRLTVANGGTLVITGL